MEFEYPITSYIGFIGQYKYIRKEDIILVNLEVVKKQDWEINL